MRHFSFALLLVCGCQFHLEGIAPPGGAVKPGDPSGNGTTTTPDPGTSNDPTPTPTSDPIPDMASATPTPTPTPTPGMPTPDMMSMPLAVHVGDACNNDNDCMETNISCFKSLGVGLGKVNLPGGYCSEACGSNAPCPTGSECIATLFGSFCLEKCNGMGPQGGCRPGYSCCTSVGACGLESFCGKGNDQ